MHGTQQGPKNAALQGCILAHFDWFRDQARLPRLTAWRKTRRIQLPDFKLDGAVAEILVNFCHHGLPPSSTLILCYMDVLISSRRPPLHSLQWRKDFSVRQTTLYHGQDNRLRVPAGGSVIDEFFRSLNPSLSPPRRHELLRRFLEQTGARHSLPDIIRGRKSTANGQILAIVDDRCDPCLQFTGISDNAAFLPVRQWGSDEYIRRPPEGLYARVSGMDAEMLYAHLNQDVGCFLTEVWILHQLLTESRSCRAPNYVRLPLFPTTVANGQVIWSI